MAMTLSPNGMKIAGNERLSGKFVDILSNKLIAFFHLRSHDSHINPLLHLEGLLLHRRLSKRLSTHLPGLSVFLLRRGSKNFVDESEI